MFTTDALFKSIMQWAYSMMVSVISLFIQIFQQMSDRVFDETLVKNILLFFFLFGEALFTVAFVIALLETIIEYQSSGNGHNFVTLMMNAIKGFLVSLLFTTIPQLLFKLTSQVENMIVQAITQQQNFGDILLSNLSREYSFDFSVNGSSSTGNMDLKIIIFAIIFLYVIIKVVIGNIKRSGILLTLIFIGTFHIFQIPRGYTDGFSSWCKQVIGLCITHFAQNILLVLGISLFAAEFTQTNWILGLGGMGLMLAATEVPRVAQHFGLDTSFKGNFASAAIMANSTFSIGSRIIGGFFK